MPEPSPRDRILEAAEQSFSSSGLAGARVAAIAEAAGVNKAMLYYYFGSKEELYEAVLARTLDRVSALAEEVLSAEELPARERMLRFLRGYRGIVLGNPHFARMLLWDLLDGGHRFLRLARPRLGQLLSRTLPTMMEAQRAGELNPEVDPLLAPFVLISPLVLFNPALPVMRQLVPGDAGSLRARFERTAEAIALHGLDVSSPDPEA